MTQVTAREARPLHDALSELAELRETLARERNARALLETMLSTKAQELASAEQEALLARAQLMDAIESIAEAFLVTDCDHRVVLCNRKYQTLFDESVRPVAAGSDLVDALCRSAGAGHYGAEAAVDPATWLAQRVAQLGANSGPWELTLSDGRLFRVEERPTGRGGTVSLALDITDLRRRERSEQDLREQLYQAQKMEAIGRLAGGIAHDFNNLLASILGYATFLTEDLDNNSDAHDYALQIQRSGQRAKDLVEQILAFSRREQAVRRVADLRGMVEETLTFVRATMPSSIRLHAVLPEAPLRIEANSTQISQVAMNLCVNARDAIGEGGSIVVTLDDLTIDGGCAQGMEDREGEGLVSGASGPVRVRTLSDGTNKMWVGILSSPGRYARLRITDTGCGIRREVMDRMLEPFFTTKGVGKGTGLGLASVQGIVLSHDGAMVIESKPGVGTEVTVLLPAATVAPLAGDAPTAALDLHGSEHVMVVDDEPQVGAMVARVLERHGYRATVYTHAIDAAEALELTEPAFDLVISDQTMPDMTGYELMRYTRKRHQAVPVILLTGFSEILDETQAKEGGAVCLLRKPVDQRHLLATVRRALDTRPIADPTRER